MSAEFRKLPLKKFPKRVPKTENVEAKFWKAFTFPTIVKEYTSINNVEFSRVPPYDCLVTCSGKIQIFTPYTNEVKKTSSRNKENVYGAKYRSDGKLLVAGGESGTVQVLDVNSRAILRNLKGHNKPTHVCSFGVENSVVYSASDDKTFRSWDLPVQKETFNIKAHKDYIRCGCINETNTNQFVTGSYDHTVKVWDCRSSSVAMEMNHGAPVECVLMHTNGSILLSAGSNYISVWDMLGGGRLMNQFSNHQKTITTLKFDDQCERLFSGSLDRHVKIYNMQDYSLLAHIEYPSPILALDVSKDTNHLTVGMADGAISLRHRPKPKTPGAQSGDKPQPEIKRSMDPEYEPKPGTFLYRLRNQTMKPTGEELVIGQLRKAHQESNADKCLRQYRYHDALDAVISADKHATRSYAINLILELSRRDALEIALSNRDSVSLRPIIMFLVKNVSNHLYSKILIPVCNLLIDMYSHLIGKDEKFTYLVRKLKSRIEFDLVGIEDMIQLGGAVEQIFAMANAAPTFADVNAEKAFWESPVSEVFLDTLDANEPQVTNNEEDAEDLPSDTEEAQDDPMEDESEFDFVVDSSENEVK